MSMRVLVECPNMTLAALNGTRCSQNGDILLTKPSPVAFRCTYQHRERQTTYRWSMDGTPQSGLTSNVVYISIPSGSHKVTCEANINVSDIVPPNAADDCTCTESSTLNVTVIGT